MKNCKESKERLITSTPNSHNILRCPIRSGVSWQNCRRPAELNHPRQPNLLKATGDIEGLQPSPSMEAARFAALAVLVQTVAASTTTQKCEGSISLDSGQGSINLPCVSLSECPNREHCKRKVDLQGV